MTDERSSDPELVLRAEGLVAKLAAGEPDWDALAARVSARLGEAPAPDEALLSAPFPEAEGESALDRLVVAKPAAAPVVSEREAVSLADLARASVARRGSRDASNIAKESLAVASQSRNQGERAAPRAEPQVAAASPAPSSRRPRAPAADSRGPWIGVAIAAVGLAAGFGLYVAGQRRAPEIVSVTAPTAEIVAPEGKAEQRAPLAEAKPLDLAAAPVAEEVDELPAASAAAPALAAGAVEKSARELGQTAAERSSQAVRPAVRAFGAGVTPERVVLEEERAGAKSAAHASTHAAKPAESSPLRPAELSPQPGPTDRPSAGAAQAAVGAVLGAARACIAGHSAPSSATLVFGSDGQVSRVNVAGPAAGTQAASCVESALKKARVQPFAAESFSLSVTVRPP
jgi:hypothetical protein